MISESEQFTLDIDWFFASRNKIGFVASAGGRLPRSIARSEENIQLLSDYFRSLPEISNVQVNPLLEEILSHRKIDDSYLADFVYMAEKGLYAFDKTFLNNFQDDMYHLVAKPLISLAFNSLPIDIIDILRETMNDSDIETGFKISSFS